MSEVETTPEEVPAALQQYLEPEAPEVEQEPDAEAPETPVETPEPEPEAEVDPVAEKALKAGWRPKEEYDGDPDTWVDAGEFVRRQPLFDQIKAERKRAKDLEKKIEAVTKYAERAAETARAQTLREIEQRRLQAVEDGDRDAFEEADKAYVEAQKEPEVEENEPDAVEPDLDSVPDEVKDFAKRNASWFEQNYVMTEESVKATQFYRNKGMPLGEALERAEADIKRKFPDYFESSTPKRRQAVAEGSKEARPRSYGYNDLTSEQKAVYSAMKGHMKIDEFIAELKKQGEFEK